VAMSAPVYLPFLALLVCLSLSYAKRASWGRAPFTLMSCAFIVLFPCLGFLNIYYMRYGSTADHWQYLAMPATIILVVGLGARYIRASTVRWGGGAIICALAILANQRAWLFRDAESLWRDALGRNPDAWLAHNNLGVLLEGQGRHHAALAEYEAAQRLEPEFTESVFNVGVVLGRLGRTDEAMARYQEALLLKPDYAVAHTNLASILQARGHFEEAIGHYRQALRLRPGLVEAHCNLGLALATQGDLPQAIGELQEALRLNPDFTAAHTNLGSVYLRQGRDADALTEFAAAVRLAPATALTHDNLGLVLLRLRRLPEAVTQFQEALRLDPGDATAKSRLVGVNALNKPDPH